MKKKKYGYIILFIYNLTNWLYYSLLLKIRKKTIETVEQFDFLKDVVANIPDPLESSTGGGGGGGAGAGADEDNESSKPTRSRRSKSSSSKAIKDQEMEL